MNIEYWAEIVEFTIIIKLKVYNNQINKDAK